MGQSPQLNVTIGRLVMLGFEAENRVFRSINILASDIGVAFSGFSPCYVLAFARKMERGKER